MQRHRSFLLTVCFFLSFSSFAFCESRSGRSGDVKATKKGVIHLDESNWQQVLQGEWMVEFHAPWCPACRDFQPEFKRFAEWQRDGPELKYGAVDVHAYPGLSGRFLISALPSIYHVKDGEFRQYTGIRDGERMRQYIRNEDWSKSTPTSMWLNPTSMQMGAVGQFFKMSMYLKNLHTWMVDDQKLPNWVTYVIFGVATIAMGGLIGVILVYVIEFITGARKHSADTYESAGKITSKTDERRAKINRSPSASEGEDEDVAAKSAGSGSDAVSSGSDAEGTDEDTRKKSKPVGKPQIGRIAKDGNESGGDSQVRRRAKVRREE